MTPIRTIGLAAATAAIAAVLLAGCSSSPHPAATHTPKPVTTVAPGSAPSSPSATGAPRADGSDGSGDASGPATPCTTAQCQSIAGEVAETPVVTAFIKQYATINSSSKDLSAWRAALAPYTDVQLPVTVIARQDSGLGALTVSSHLADGATALTVNPAGLPGADGTWQYNITGTVIASYTSHPDEQTSYWSVPGQWQVTVDSATKKVAKIVESVPDLQKAA